MTEQLQTCKSPVGGRASVETQNVSIDGDIVAQTKSYATLPISFTVFPLVSADIAEQCDGSWADVVRTVSDPQEHATKSHCPLIKLATFGDKKTDKGSIRSNDNMLGIYGVEGDYDAEEMSIERAADLLRTFGIEAILYTSASHGVVTYDKKGNQRSHGGPRWRVLAPVSQPLPVADRRRIVALLNDALGGVLANESFTDSQSYFFGKVKGVEYKTIHVRGQCIDELDLVLSENYGSTKPATTKKPTVSSAGGLEQAVRDAKLSKITEETIKDLRSAIESFTEADADDYKFWTDCGHALKSVEDGGHGEAAHELWHALSAKSPRYDYDEAESKWETFAPNTITFASIFAWAKDRGWANPKTLTADTRIDRTDTGNVALLAQIAQGRLRYVPERKCWLSWNGQRWAPDNYGTAAQEQARQVAEHYHRTAIDIAKQAKSEDLDDKERKRIEKAASGIEAWATQCRNKSRIDNMLNLAKSDARFILPMPELDRDPWLFGAGNGVIDLTTGTLRPAGQEDYVTRQSPVSFNPMAQAPNWVRFIAEISGTPDGKGHTPRPALADYLQRALGYALTGSTAEHKMFIAVGPGANGKSVLLDLLQWIMGDYCENISPETLMASRHDADAERATPAVRKLAGARAAVSSESKDGQRLDVALVKRHTGGGYITARGLHENAFTFEITHKLWLMTNHKPALDHMDDALRGRIHMIPFDMRWNRPGHPERNPLLPDGDKNLPEKLKAEAEGILAWLVAGAVRYRQEGLEPPAEVAGMTRAYFKDQDPLGLWIDECTTCAAEQGEKASDLFEEFRHWCIREGYGSESAGSHVSFAKKLQARGISSHKKKDGMRYGLQIQRESIPF